MQALYRKWRSQTFNEVVGQEHVTQTLRNALLDGRVAHAYLFSGPRGTGKTSTARILAKALNCSEAEEKRPCGECSVCTAIAEGRMIDLIEIDAASNNSVDDIRELRDKVGFQPSEGRFKVYIIDEVHMLSAAAFNALLKTLEEPPPHARFILATTEPHKIPATVISRCQRFDFRRIPVPEIADHLQNIVSAEGFNADYEALTAIGRSAQGCMRDAVSLLDQMFSYGTDTISLAQVQQVLGTVNAEAVSGMASAIAAKDITKGLELVQQLLTDGASLVEYCHQVVEHLRGILLLQMTQDPSLLNELPKETVALMAEQASQMPQATTLAAIKRFSDAVSELKGGYQPQLPLELALIESIQASAAPPPVGAVSPAQAHSVQLANQPTTQTATASSTAPPTFQTAAAQEATSQQKGGEQPTQVNPDSNHPAEPGAATTQANNSSTESQSTDAVPNDNSASDDPPGEVQSDDAAVQRLSNSWDDFKKQVRQECSVREQAALNSVKDIAIAHGEVAFAFGNNPFASKMIQNPEVHAKVTRILSTFLGQNVILTCQEGEKARLSGLKQNSLGGQATGADPLVEFAVNELGAEVTK